MPMVFIYQFHNIMSVQVAFFKAATTDDCLHNMIAVGRYQLPSFN